MRAEPISRLIRATAAAAQSRSLPAGPTVDPLAVAPIGPTRLSILTGDRCRTDRFYHSVYL